MKKIMMSVQYADKEIFKRMSKENNLKCGWDAQKKYWWLEDNNIPVCFERFVFGTQKAYQDYSRSINAYISRPEVVKKHKEEVAEQYGMSLNEYEDELKERERVMDDLLKGKSMCEQCFYEGNTADLKNVCPKCGGEVIKLD